MCGICGWVGFDRDLGDDASRRTLAGMTRTMECRGPDAEGTWVDTHAALGHRRLAVIDLPGGSQPMELPDEAGQRAPVIVYSGETYNFRELRRQLAGRGHRFRTDSDTEVVLHAHREWGRDDPRKAVQRLNGMFAYAIWDPGTEELVLVRDRLGVKPLYYHPTPDGVLFGSEPKAILANPLTERRVDLDGLRRALSWVHDPSNAVFAGLREVPPGAVVRVSRRGVQEERYWQLEDTGHTDDVPTTVRNVREILEDTAKRQLIADVPLCTLLSGGLDSSADSPESATVDRSRTALNSRYNDVSMSPIPAGMSRACSVAARTSGSISCSVESLMSVWSVPTNCATSRTYGASGVPRTSSAVKLSS
jgi:asparagine synthase (glutamine-hydrolysing)